MSQLYLVLVSRKMYLADADRATEGWVPSVAFESSEDAEEYRDHYAGREAVVVRIEGAMLLQKAGKS